MADDITLTVRVRDLSRGDLNRLQGNLNRMRQSMQGVNRSTDSAGRNARLLSRDLQQLGARLQSVQQTGSMTRRELAAINNSFSVMSRTARNAARAGEITRTRFREVTREIASMRAQFVLLDDDSRRLDRANARLLLFQHRIRDSNANAGFLRRTMSRMGDWGAGGLRGAVLGTGLFMRMLKGLNERMNFSKRITVILIAALLLMGPAAAALGALLVTALGGAFIALGAFALRGSTQVRSAFTDMKNTMGSVIREAALPMESALVGGIQQTTVAVKQLQPALTAAFTAAGPLISNFFGAFTDFASRAMPGFVSALNSSKPVMNGFRVAMGSIGQGFGDMFAAMTANGGAEALKNVWITLGREIANLLVGIGEFISMAAKSGTATALMVGLFRSLSGVLNIVEIGLRAVDSVFGGLFQHINNNVIGLDKLTGGIDGMGTSFIAAGQDAASLKKQLAEVDKEIKRIEEVQKRAKSSFLPDNKPLMSSEKATDQDLERAMSQRTALLGAISDAENGAAGATNNHATAVKDLISQIQSLADLNRGALDAQAGQQQAIDDAVKKQKEYANTLKWTNGQVDVNNEASRTTYELLSKVAQTTKEATDKAIAANAPWEQIRGNWQQGYDNLVRLADGMGLSGEQARQLATQIMGIPPSREVVIKAAVQSAVAGLQSVMTAYQATPGQKTVTVQALTEDAMFYLRNLGFTVTRLPDGSVSVTSNAKSTKHDIDAIASAISFLDGKRAVTYTYHKVQTQYSYSGKPPSGGGSLHDVVASGAVFRGKKFAGGGIENHQAQIAPAGSWRVWGEPETGGESYIPLSVTKRARSRQIAADTVGILGGSVEWFAKGGVTKSEKEARSEARGDLTLSHFGKMAGYKNNEFRHALALPDTLGALVGDLNKWRSVIIKSTHGAIEKNLLKQLDKAGKSLIKYEKSLSKVEKSLDKAKTKLDDLKQAASSLKESVTSGVMSATNITQVASGDKNITVADIMTQMTQSRDKASAFSGALANLQKRGVSKEIIQQIAQAGIEGGGLETAGALLSASSSEIASINSMQSQINASAKAAGNTAADAMYGAGIKAAEGLVNGLTKQKKKIEQAMMAIAKAMEKSIKAALGIKSPSRVMQKVGHYTAEGFAVGVKKNSKVDSAWSSMLTTTPSGVARSGSGGNGVHVIQLTIGNTMLDEIILDSNRRTVRTRGGNVQAVYGKR